MWGMLSSSPLNQLEYWLREGGLGWKGCASFGESSALLERQVESWLGLTQLGAFPAEAAPFLHPEPGQRG